MVEFEVQTRIAAPPVVCFDLARNVAFHARSLAHTDERIVDQPAHPLLELGDEVEFEGHHFGLVQRHRARITAFKAPTFFRDTMVRGAFRSFVHDHVFEPVAGGTLMRDEVRFTVPLGWIGWVVGQILLKAYLQRLLVRRGEEIRQAAEGVA